MNNWMTEKRKNLNDFFHDYGKVIFVFVLLSVSLISVCLIVSLVSPRKLRVSFLDVGQGDAIFIQTPSGKNVLIDGGATNVILTRLADEMSYFDHDIDVMIATHPDADHVIGLIPVLEKYDIRTVVVSPALGHTKVFDNLNSNINGEQADVHIARTGDEIDFHDGVIIKVLYPKLNYVANKIDTNDASVSMLVTYGDQSFLLTGDLPSTRENFLISELSSLHPRRESSDSNITVYKAGHHGSKTSNSEQLLSYIHPEYTVISAGKQNKYGHPNIETIERLQKYTKEIISTVDRGTISFATDGRMIEVETGR